MPRYFDESDKIVSNETCNYKLTFKNIVTLLILSYPEEAGHQTQKTNEDLKVEKQLFLECENVNEEFRH